MWTPDHTLKWFFLTHLKLWTIESPINPLTVKDLKYPTVPRYQPLSECFCVWMEEWSVFSKNIEERWSEWRHNVYVSIKYTNAHVVFCQPPNHRFCQHEHHNPHTITEHCSMKHLLSFCHSKQGKIYFQSANDDKNVSPSFKGRVSNYADLKLKVQTNTTCETTSPDKCKRKALSK